MPSVKRFSSAYRFKDGKEITAVLDEEGKLSLHDGTGSLEMYNRWEDYVTTVTGDKPVRGSEEDIVNQLSITLGSPEAITADGLVKTRDSVEDNVEENKVVKKAAGATAAAKPKPVDTGKKKPGKKAVAKKDKATPVDPETLPDCLCGCGKKTLAPTRQFLQGHDARFHSYVKKIERGEMKVSELTPAGRAWLREHGITAGSNKK